MRSLLLIIGLCLFKYPTSFVSSSLVKSTASNQLWTSLTTSSLGDYTYAATNAAGLYSSTDFGSSWTASASSVTSSVYLLTATCDYTGQHVVGGTYKGHILVSSDYGASFAVAAAPVAQWRSSCMSYDGSIAYAATFNASMYISYDAGSSWNELTTQPHTQGYYSVASDSSGQFIIAAIAANSPVYVSQDYGASWTAPASIKAAAIYTATAVSYGGQIMVAAAFVDGIYISYNNGTTWRQASSQRLSYTSIACDRNCSYIIAAAYNSRLLLSLDSGSTWFFLLSPGSRLWQAVSSNYDGSYVAAAVSGSGIWTGSIIPDPTAEPTMAPTSPTLYPTSQPTDVPSHHPPVRLEVGLQQEQYVVVALFCALFVVAITFACCRKQFMRGGVFYGHCGCLDLCCTRWEYLNTIARNEDDDAIAAACLDVPIEAQVELVSVAPSTLLAFAAGAGGEEKEAIVGEAAVVASATRTTPAAVAQAIRVMNAV